jgi:hypothetical protein
MNTKKMIAAVLLTASFVGGTATTAFARQGADDPAGHVRHGRAHHGPNHR